MFEKYIFLDIDGTLLGADGIIPKSAEAAIKKARELGHKVFICTGRPIVEVGEDITYPGFDGIICSSGNYVITQGKDLYNYTFPDEEVEEILNQIKEDTHLGIALEAHSASYMNQLQLDTYREGFKASRNMNDEEALAHMAYCRMLNMEEHPYENVHKVSLFTPQLARLNEILDMMSERYRVVTHGFHDGVYEAEITEKNTSKASGIDIMLNYYHASIEQSIAMGDSMNDSEMIQHVHLGICMGNGDELLKQMADVVCDRYDNDGLAKAFETYVFND